jgi:hypothetical protein
MGVKPPPAPWRATALTAVGVLLAVAGQGYRWYVTQPVWPDPGPPVYATARCSGTAASSPGGSIPAGFHPVAVINCWWRPGPTGPVLTEQRGTGNVEAVAAAFGRRRLGHRVEVFTRAESVHFLTRRAPSISDNEAVKLAEELGDLPLALEQPTGLRRTCMPSSSTVRLPRGDQLSKPVRTRSTNSWPSATRKEQDTSARASCCRLSRLTSYRTS